MNRPSSAHRGPAESFSLRVIRSLLALLVAGLCGGTLVGDASAMPCAATMEDSCSCCTAHACCCEAPPPQDQPRPSLPAPTRSHETIVLIRAHDGEGDGLKPVVPDAHGQRWSWVMDAATSGRRVPLYCRHCSRLI